jgi:MraZ protein
MSGRRILGKGRSAADWKGKNLFSPVGFPLQRCFMFIGEYQATIDEKGRISIPAKFRTQLNERVVVTRGLDNSLFLYTMEEWKNLAEKLASLPISQANTRAFSRLMLAGAMDCEVDKQGRITLPGYLKEFAQIQKKIVFAGLYNRIEVWSDELWSTYKQQTEKESNNIAEQLGTLGV